MFAFNSNDLPPDWQAVLPNIWQATPLQQLQGFLQQQYANGHKIYPSQADIFQAFRLTPFDKVKVVILGQDPYHGADQAHGLAFSVPEGIPLPPSLRNIYRELASDLQQPVPKSGCLTSWAQQGVLLLNSVLTVTAEQAGSHRGQGWEWFTDQVIAALNAKHQHLVFMLWGSDAQRKAAKVDILRHCVLTAPHPSPLSAYRGFFGCRHFSKANFYLQQQGQDSINW